MSKRKTLVIRGLLVDPGGFGLQLRRANRLVIFGFGLFVAASATAQSQPDAVREAQRLTRVAQVAQQQGRYDDAIKAYQTITVVAAGSPKMAASARVSAGNILM